MDGKTVILHPLTVGLAGKNRGEMIAGILHDVVEDTEFTFDDLLEKGNPIALAVKWNDLTHNLTRGRGENT